MFSIIKTIFSIMLLFTVASCSLTMCAIGAAIDDVTQPRHVAQPQATYWTPRHVNGGVDCWPNQLGYINGRPICYR